MYFNKLANDGNFASSAVCDSVFAGMHELNMLRHVLHFLNVVIYRCVKYTAHPAHFTTWLPTLEYVGWKMSTSFLFKL